MPCLQVMPRLPPRTTSPFPPISQAARQTRSSRTSGSAAGRRSSDGYAAVAVDAGTGDDDRHGGVPAASNAVQLSVEPRLASWDRAGHLSQVALAGFLAHVDALAAPAMMAIRGQVAVGLTVGLPGTVPLIDGGRDLDNYLLPIARQLGPDRVDAAFGRKIHGPSSLAVGPADPETTVATPQFSSRMTGSCERAEWKQDLHDRLLRAQAATMDPGPVAMAIAITTGSGRAELDQPAETAHRRFRPRTGRRPCPAVPPPRRPHRQPWPAPPRERQPGIRRDHQCMVGQSLTTRPFPRRPILPN
jgi:hypothetical protein